MSNQRVRSLAIYEEQEDTVSSSPEKLLLAAVFERAIRDLFCLEDLHIVNDAINWFSYRPKDRPLKFTYVQVKDMFRFSKRRLDYIDAKVAEALSLYDQYLCKRKAHREGNSQLDERQWDCFSKKNSAAQWRRRVK